MHKQPPIILGRGRQEFAQARRGSGAHARVPGDGSAAQRDGEAGPGGCAAPQSGESHGGGEEDAEGDSMPASCARFCCGANA